MANSVSSPCTTSIFCGCLAFAFPAVPHFNNRCLRVTCSTSRTSTATSYQYSTLYGFLEPQSRGGGINTGMGFINLTEYCHNITWHGKELHAHDVHSAFSQLTWVRHCTNTSGPGRRSRHETPLLQTVLFYLLLNVAYNPPTC